MKYEKKLYCQRRDEGGCKGRLTVEHALYYAGKKIQDPFALITLCAYHHGVDQYYGCEGQNKRRHREIAEAQATPEDKAKYPRYTWIRESA